MSVLPEIEFYAIAAIDFGTSRSGFGYAFTATPNDIQCPQNWAGRGGELKTLTNIILDRNSLKCTHFGYDAREHYFDTDEDDEELGKGLFFETFKMSLYGEDGIQQYLTSACGTRVESHIVFREALGFMKDQVLKKISVAEAGDTRVLPRDIMWVVTVPGMWRDQSKAAMRKAAEAAGMGTHHNLVLALEPEAASLHVRCEYKMDQLDEGSKYILVDCGGGTVDFSCHQLLQHSVRETHAALGVPWGSTYIDKRFIELLYDVFSKSTITKFKKSNPVEWLQLHDHWEQTKLRMDDFVKPKRIPLPFAMIAMIGEREIRKQCKAFSTSLKAKKLKMVVKYSSGLKVDGNTIKYLFSPILEGISDQIKELLKDEEVSGSTHLFVVGGFADSGILRQHLTEAFPNLNPVIPKRASLAVIKGAVHFGLNPSAVETRKARFTYGKGLLMPFEEGLDPVSKMVVIDGDVLCAKRFMVFVKKNQDIGFDETVTQTTTLVDEDDISLTQWFYTSDNENPRYVTEPGCAYIGSITIPLETPGNFGDGSVTCNMKFGATEIQVTSFAKGGQTREVKLDLINTI